MVLDTLEGSWGERGHRVDEKVDTFWGESLWTFLILYVNDRPSRRERTNSPRRIKYIKKIHCRYLPMYALAGAKEMRPSSTARGPTTAGFISLVDQIPPSTRGRMRSGTPGKVWLED